MLGFQSTTTEESVCLMLTLIISGATGGGGFCAMQMKPDNKHPKTIMRTIFFKNYKLVRIPKIQNIL